MHNIVVFGASTTYGAFDQECGGWVNRLMVHTFNQCIASGYTNKSLVYNCGVSGDRIDKLEERYKSELGVRMHEDRGTVVIICIGINDSQVEVATGATKTSIDTYRTKLTGMVKYLKEKECAVFCVGLGAVDESKVNPKPRDPAFAFQNQSIKKFDAAMREVALAEEAAFVPVMDIFENRPELVPDGVHPTADGHRLIFERVREHLEKASII